MKSGILLVLGVCLVLSAVPTAQQAGPIKATGAIELKDAAGDMTPISSSSGDLPAVDVVLLAIKSDGARVTFTATLNDPPGRFATAPVTVLIDVDNNPATGTKPFGSKPGRFEYKAEVSLCIKHSDESESCSGGSTKGTPTVRYGAMNLTRLKGDSEYGGDTVIDNMGFPGARPSVKTPVTAKVIEAAFDYADIKAKPGQVIRLLAAESGSTPKDDGFFPIVLLTLK